MSQRIITVMGGLAATLLPSTAAAAEGADGGGGSWLWLLVFTVNFAAFVAVLVYFAAPFVLGFFGERAAVIRANFDRLESAFRKAQEYKGRVAAQMEQLEEEVKRLGEDMEAETAFQVRRIRDSAREVAERLRRDTEMTITAQAQDARRRVRERLAAAAAETARELISRSFGPGDQKHLLDGFINRLSVEAQ